MGYEPIEPPAYLFHGTAKRFLASIQEKGLIKGNRHHVHLSPDTETARRVGQQHGRPVILKVHSADMWRDGYIFYRSTNGVWLVETVPTSYLEVLAG